MNKWVWISCAVVSVALVVASILKIAPLGMTEVLGFVTGAVCVLMVVEQNIWNFPIGIVNNIFFIALFFTSRLYGDMALQFVYVVLALIGWYKWVHVGKNETKLQVTHIPIRQVPVLLFIGVLTTYGLYKYFISINDSAPFLDAITTAMSLIAQYLLNCKRIENWYVWITADIIYIYLYIQRDLNLTAVLYVLFMAMCVAGLFSWFKTYNNQKGLCNETV